jgi:hypothetical protein
METPGKAHLQFLAVKKDGSILPGACSVLEISRDGMDGGIWGISFYWTDENVRPLSGGVSEWAGYKFTNIYQSRLQGMT